MSDTIYFIGNESEGPVKIGFTGGSVESRLRAIQTGSPVRLSVLDSFPGCQTRELQVHHFLRLHRLEGEWFERLPALTFLKRVKESIGQELIKLSNNILLQENRFVSILEYDDLISISKLFTGEIPFRSWVSRGWDVDSCDIPVVGNFYDYISFFEPKRIFVREWIKARQEIIKIANMDVCTENENCKELERACYGPRWLSCDYHEVYQNEKMFD